MYFFKPLIAYVANCLGFMRKLQGGCGKLKGNSYFDKNVIIVLY